MSYFRPIILPVRNSLDRQRQLRLAHTIRRCHGAARSVQHRAPEVNRSPNQQPSRSRQQLPHHEREPADSS